MNLYKQNIEISSKSIENSRVIPERRIFQKNIERLKSHGNTIETKIYSISKLGIIKKPIMTNKTIEKRSNSTTEKKIFEGYNSYTTILDKYLIGPILGFGSFAVVKLAVNQSNNDEKYGIKIYQKYKINDPIKKRIIKNEIFNLKILNHPNIIQLMETVENESTVNNKFNSIFK